MLGILPTRICAGHVSHGLLTTFSTSILSHLWHYSTRSGVTWLPHNLLYEKLVSGGAGWGRGKDVDEGGFLDGIDEEKIPADGKASRWRCSNRGRGVGIWRLGEKWTNYSFNCGVCPGCAIASLICLLADWLTDWTTSTLPVPSTVCKLTCHVPVISALILNSQTLYTRKSVTLISWDRGVLERWNVWITEYCILGY